MIRALRVSVTSMDWKEQSSDHCLFIIIVDCFDLQMKTLTSQRAEVDDGWQRMGGRVPERSEGVRDLSIRFG